MTMQISIEDPRTDDVRELLQQHLEFCHSVTPAEGVFALDVERLRVPGTTLFGIRDAGILLGVCALKLIDQTHAELKSMHTAASSRQLGIGSQLLEHVLSYAAAGGITRVSLETGTFDAFIAARNLYSKFKFVETGRFGDYPDSPTSAFMTLELT